ncbi:MAG: hypothetical protein ACLTDR_02960 [Adlercreutzia equolifaciens]
MRGGIASAAPTAGQHGGSDAVLLRRVQRRAGHLHSAESREAVLSATVRSCSATWPSLRCDRSTSRASPGKRQRACGLHQVGHPDGRRGVLHQAAEGRGCCSCPATASTPRRRASGLLRARTGARGPRASQADHRQVD